MTKAIDLEMDLKSDDGDLGQPPGVTAMPVNNIPDETWSIERLLDFGQKSLCEGEECDRLAVPLARRSIVARFGAGHACSILRDRLKPLGKWCDFQAEHSLPRTSVWEVVEVYEAAGREDLTKNDLAERYSTWTGILLAFGLVKARRNGTGGCIVEHVEPPAEDDDAEDDFDEDDWDDEEPEDEDPEEDEDQQEPDQEPEEADPEDEAPTPVTDEQIVAANAFVGAVGGLTHAARILVIHGAKGGDKEPVKGIMRAAVVAARSVLDWAEINEVVRSSELRAKGAKVKEI